MIPFFILMLYFYLNNIAQPDKLSLLGKEEVPSEYLPIYKAAEKEYGVPWNLLAAHHRVETKFSTMNSLVSPVGAEGHMQFMPCTFVGWSHPSCSGLGKGDIPEKQKTDPAIIEKYGGYGVDANGDGVADPFQIEDAVFSAANYLARNGAADGEIEQAVLAYNHSDEYVEDVLYYAEKYIEEPKGN
ncbi:lytic murein transglycosylase [Bacillus haikouensis]|nr:lytic murein transglycosylase [[Bacillus] enclensis]MBH9965145.1 lytic murein transglycosylase [[Bacillus] enclensis]QWC24936.1 lytic murein transglycosylase [Bacillus haikouensis]